MSGLSWKHNVWVRIRTAEYSQCFGCLLAANSRVGELSSCLKMRGSSNTCWTKWSGINGWSLSLTSFPSPKPLIRQLYTALLCTNCDPQHYNQTIKWSCNNSVKAFDVVCFWYFYGDCIARATVLIHTCLTGWFEKCILGCNYSMSLTQFVSHRGASAALCLYIKEDQP